MGRLGGLLSVGRLLQIVSALVLIKFLTPYQMGSVAFLTAVFAGIYSLTNLGFDRYLIHADGTDIGSVVVNNIWTLQLIRGVFVFILCLGIAIIIPVVTEFNSEITYQLTLIGLALFIYNLSNPAIALNERNGDFNQVANCRGLSMIGGALVVLFSAYFFRSPWVYVLGQLVNTLLYTLFSFHLSSNRPRLEYDSIIVKKILYYCKYLLVISSVSVVAVQFESYYIAIAFSAEVLGVYFTWARLVSMPRELLVQICDRILFTKACSSRRDNQSLIKEHLFILLTAVAIILPFYSITWFHGGWIISLLAGDEWVSYHWVGQFFVVISSFHLIALLFSPLVLSNFPKTSSILRSSEVLVMVVMMLWLGGLYEIRGLLIASMLAIFLAMLTRMFIVYRYVMTVAWYKHFSFLFSFIAVGLGIVLAVEYFFGTADVNVYPGLGIISGYLLCWFLLWALIRVFYWPAKSGIRLC